MKILYNSNPDINSVCKKYLGENVWIKFQYHNPNSGASSIVYLRLLQRREAFNDIECNVIYAGNGDNIMTYPEDVLRACAYNVSIYDPDGEYLTPVFPLDIITNEELFGRFKGSMGLSDFIGGDVLVKVNFYMFSGGTRNPFLQIPSILPNTFFIRVISKDGFEIRFRSIYEDEIYRIFDHDTFYSSEKEYYYIEDCLKGSWTSKAIIDAFQVVEPVEAYTIEELTSEFEQCELLDDNDDEDWGDEE